MSSTSQTGGIWLKFVAAVVAIIGLILAVGGIWSVVDGGPFYYLISGVGLFLTAVLLFKRNPTGLALYALILIGTFIWALSSVGFDFWALVPRLDVVVILGVVLLLPITVRPLSASRAATLPLYGSVALGVLLLGTTFFMDPSDQAGSLPTTIANMHPANPENVPDEEWHAYGRTQAGDRWSPLTQINSKNVNKLKVAWVMRTHDLPQPTDPGEATNEATPIEFNGTLYFCSIHQKLFAVDAATGTTKWVFDPKVVIKPSYQHLTCRGVSKFTKPANPVDSEGKAVSGTDCADRIILMVNDGRVLEVDAATGQRCHAFGNDGEVDLRFSHQPYTTLGEYEPTSPPVVTDKYIIVNSAVRDNGSVHQPSGATRAYDVYTGRLAWVFDAANPDPNEMPSEQHPHFHANSPNSWIVSSYDKNLNLVYIPMGVGTPDQWGGYRSKEAERFVPGIIALNADTGKLVWFFQTVHHDLWDMDVPSQPSLVDITQKDGTNVPAIYIPTKTGDLFVLDRRTGKPIVPVTERPVPQQPAPGDRTSPTQPFSDLSLRPKKPLADKDMWGATIFDQMVCTIYFHTLRYDGPFTPPSLQGTLVFPGDLGVFEWGGLSVDPQRQVAFTNPIYLPFVSQLVPRGPKNPLWPQEEAKGKGGEAGLQPNYGIPYAINLHAFLNPVLTPIGLNLPCRNPPWGTVAGIDLRTNKVVWQHRNGTIRDAMHGSSLPIPLPPLKVGVPSLGGSMSTAGDVAFLTSTMDYYIRAYDITTGHVLWKDRLPAGAQSTPMTYSVNGHQYIVTYAGGHGSFLSRMGDYLIAYKLPDDAIADKK
ncbi:membrane-bound PQQ-dependent dehydrogenase, glucose/quinate/shikimate family [Saccharibacter sp. 17.LH.SD]|uniref:membrane-bound PQQ-dependent dehydrogenase, glucose/quinate/shikimate family n=1 Tax=Saccharibacter sp. 17.LH.SD TaxID=2689393 RepID=UPI00136FA712|nr:membrane-bound PQQ-dependent dehydrogenase, glucose/quinate/shikimate family [Saccharibacter sp. 17.LH.SD]MXV44746.1 membrane-bound PQQ-dependent dehydrogenase, glucose/quinate/shikimate family [Saccharibacter sp. 17.LH.SD]